MQTVSGQIPLTRRGAAGSRQVVQGCRALLALLDDIATVERKAVQPILIDLWVTRYYLPGFPKNSYIPAAYTQALAEFCEQYTAVELVALERFNQSALAWLSGKLAGWHHVRMAAALTLKSLRTTAPYVSQAFK